MHIGVRPRTNATEKHPTDKEIESTTCDRRPCQPYVPSEYKPAYLDHVAAKLRTLDTMKTRMITIFSRRWAFDCYRREQLAVHKLTENLLVGCVGPTVVVWGNGSFGSSYRGHASAPNKRLHNRLVKYVHVVLSSEYRSSQRSGCCHVKMTDRPSPRRVTVKQCTKCKTLVSLCGLCDPWYLLLSTRTPD
jgi:hypothetical protein